MKVHGAMSSTGVTEPQTLMDYSRLGPRPRDLQYGRRLQGRSLVLRVPFESSTELQWIREALGTHGMGLRAPPSGRGCLARSHWRVRGNQERRPRRQRSNGRVVHSQAAANVRNAGSHLATSTNDPGGKKAGRVLTKWKSTFYHVFSGVKRKYLHMSSGRELLSYFWCTTLLEAVKALFITASLRII